MRNKLTKIPIIIFLFLAVACSNGRMPDISFPLKDMNKVLELTAPPELSTHKIGDVLRLLLINSSDTTIILPPDYGVHIYQDNNGVWQPVNNLMDYPSGERVVHPQKDGPFQEVIIPMYPNILSDQPVKVRVVIIGNYYKSDGTKGGQVSAFVDVIIKPNEKTIP